MNKVLKIIAEYGAEFGIRSFSKEESLAVLLTPYLPYAWINDKPYIDSYYFVSNRTYHSVKLLRERIKADAGVNAWVDNKLDFKKESAELGLSSGGLRHTVSYHSVYGTYFYLTVLRIGAPFESVTEGVTAAESAECPAGKPFVVGAGLPDAGSAAGAPLKTVFMPDRILRTSHVQTPALCADCGKCVKACPTGAVKEAGGICREACLREKMNAGFEGDSEGAAAARNLVLGCPFCQAVCPMNAHIKRLKYPEEIISLLEAYKLSGGGAERLKALIGANLINSNFKKLLENAERNIKNRGAD